MKNKFYPVAFILLILIAVYIMYGEGFKPNVDLAQYKEVCEKYLLDKQGEYSKEEKLALVNQVNYLLPATISELNNSVEKEVKNCANQLAQQLD